MRVLLCFIIACLAMPVRAELLIELVGGRTDAVAIAVVPFALPAGIPEPVDRIVANDLHRSGQFRPIPPEDMLSRPTRESEIAYRDFRVIGAEFLVVGRGQHTSDGRYRIEYELHDVARGVKILEQTWQPEPAQLRDVAHAIADRIYEQLTGVPGAFSTRILYVTFQRDAKWPFQLQYADADGARAQTILRSREPIMSPSWSPDGRRVAYVSFEAGGMPAIYVHELATTERKKVAAFRGINGAPDWSPDGKRLALTLSRDGNPEIYVLHLETGELERLTDHYAIDTEPRWLPDGQSLVFTSSRGGGPQIYRLDLRDRSVRRLSFEGAYNARPAVTPDGRYLVYVHRRNDRFHIAVQDMQRGTFNIVTRSDMDESPSVAPNGSMVVYATQQDGRGVLQAVSIDGRIKVHLPSKEGEVREPAWSPILH